jgi:hypothetical protein
MLLEALRGVAYWRDAQAVPEATPARAVAGWAGAQPGCAQALTTPPAGTPIMRHGAAAERRLRVEDAAMRHGRQRRRLRVAGDKRQVWRDWASRLIVAVGGTPAHAPDARVTDAIATALAAQPGPRRAWPIDRASVARTWVPQRTATLAMFCKAWPVPQGPWFPPTACTLDWPQHVRHCPGGVTMPLEPGGMVTVPAATCAPCPVRPRGTTSVSGRSLSRHPDEAVGHEWRERQQTPPGRATWRERVAVEPALAHMGHWQGRRARYRGVRTHVCDLRRCAVMHNLPVFARLTKRTHQAA